MSADEITLTLPAERDFHRVAHLVLGDLAVRLNVTFEHLEDLQLALDGLLKRGGSGEDLTLAVKVAEGALEARVGPFAGDRLSRELGRGDEEAVGLRRILDTVVDGVEVDELEGAQWVRLTKRVSPVP